MELTEFLQLNKPGYENLADIEILNENFDKIDLNAKTSAQNLDTHISQKATQTVDGHMTKGDKSKLDGIANGANNYVLPVATESILGGIKIGANLSILNGILSGAAPYILPEATASVLGGIKVGSNLEIINGVLSANVGVDTCMFPIGSILMFDDHTINPATLFPGTTWVRRAENRSIRGAANGEGTGLTGGSDTVNISQSNLPNINLTATDHTHTRGSMDIYGKFSIGTFYNGVDVLTGTSGAVARDGNTGSSNTGISTSGGTYAGTTADFHASRNWTGATSGASATTVPLGGSGTGLNVTNAYYKMHIWKRLT